MGTPVQGRAELGWPWSVLGDAEVPPVAALGLVLQPWERGCSQDRDQARTGEPLVPEERLGVAVPITIPGH